LDDESINLTLIIKYENRLIGICTGVTGISEETETGCPRVIECQPVGPLEPMRDGDSMRRVPYGCVIPPW